MKNICFLLRLLQKSEIQGVFLPKALFLLLFVTTFLSCKKEITDVVKYREKNIVNTIDINIKSGDLVIKGWNENFIDIKTEKKIFTGIVGDLIFLNTEIKPIQDKNKLVIIAKKPDRIEGQVNLTINIPYNIRLLNINTIDSNVSITNCYSNIIYESKSGKSYIDFKGNMARIVKFNGSIDIAVSTTSSADIVLNNEYGETNLTLDKLSPGSNIDIKSISGTINLDIKPSLNFELYSISDINPVITLNRNIKHKILYDTGILFISKGIGKDVDIFLKNDSGSTFIK